MTGGQLILVGAPGAGKTTVGRLVAERRHVPFTDTDELLAERLGLSLQEAKEILDLYESPRDTQMQLNRFVQVLSAQRGRLLEQLADLQANLAEIDEHLQEAQALLQMPFEKK